MQTGIFSSPTWLPYKKLQKTGLKQTLVVPVQMFGSFQSYLSTNMAGQHLLAGPDLGIVRRHLPHMVAILL